MNPTTSEITTYEQAMADIGSKIALQQIRGYLRNSNLSDKAKLEHIIATVHAYEADQKKGKE